MMYSSNNHTSKKLLLIVIIFSSLSQMFVYNNSFSLFYSNNFVKALKTSDSSHDISVCLYEDQWISVEDYCGSVSYIEYDFFTSDKIEVWATIKENYIAFEKGVPLTNQIAHLVFYGVGAKGRFTVPTRGIWVLIFYNRINSITCFNQGQSTVNFITISDDDDPVDYDTPTNNEDDVEDPIGIDISEILSVFVLTILIILIIAVTLSISIYFLYTNHDSSNIRKRKLQQKISKILTEKGGTLIESRKFYGIEWVKPLLENEDYHTQGKLQLPKSYPKEVFDKAYYFHRKNQLVIRLRIYKHLYRS